MWFIHSICFAAKRIFLCRSPNATTNVKDENVMHWKGFLLSSRIMSDVWMCKMYLNENENKNTIVHNFQLSRTNILNLKYRTRHFWRKTQPRQLTLFTSKQHWNHPSIFHMHLIEVLGFCFRIFPSSVYAVHFGVDTWQLQ